MLPQPAALMTFVSKKLRDGEPLQRFLISALVRGGHACQGRRHLRTQSNLAVAFVFEIVKLPDDFIAAFGREKFERLQRRSIVLTKSVSPSHGAPGVEYVLPRVSTPKVGLRQRFGKKI